MFPMSAVLWPDMMRLHSGVDWIACFECAHLTDGPSSVGSYSHDLHRVTVVPTGETVVVRAHCVPRVHATSLDSL
jgi:hypothetical protein